MSAVPSALDAVPRLSCATWWLDEPMTETGGRWVLPMVESLGRKHPARVAVCWLPDGGQVIWRADLDARLVARDGTERRAPGVFVVADGATLDPLHVLALPRGWGFGVSPDGRRLATTRGDFDAGSELRTGYGHTDCGLDVWDLASGERVASVGFYDFVPTDACFEGDRRVRVAGTEGQSTRDPYAGGDAVRVVDLVTGAWAPGPREPAVVGATALADEGDGAPRPDGRARLTVERASGWELALVLRGDAGRELARHRVGSAASSEVVFAPDGRRLAVSVVATAGGRGRLRGVVWDLAARRLVATPEGAVLGFTPEGDAVTARFDGDALVVRREAASPAEVVRLPGARFPRRPLDGARLATARDGRIDVWDLPRGRVVASLDAANAVEVSCAAPAAVTTAMADRDAFRVVTARGATRVPLEGAWPAGRWAFSGDGARLCWLSDRKRAVTCWDVAAERPLWTTPLPGRRSDAREVAFVRGRDAVCVTYLADRGVVLLLLGAADGAPRGHVPLGPDYGYFPSAWSDDGARLATTYDGGRVCVREVGPTPG